MSFREILQDMVERVDGSLGAVIMGYDGISIDEYIKTGVDLDVPILSIEYGTLLKEIKNTIDLLKTGDMEEIVISTGLSKVIIRPVTDDFFVVYVLKESGNFGMARYLIKKDAQRIALELQ